MNVVTEKTNNTTAVAVAQAEARRTPVQAFIGDVMAGEKRDEVARSLPAHVPFDRFERNLANAVMREPKLLRCDPRVVFREVCKIAALGLVLDPQLGEAYLIVDRHNDVQARIGYRGLLKLAHQSGKVSACYAHDICEKDFCDIDLGTEKRITHKPDFMKPRGKAGAYYAAVKFKDGASDFEPMSMSEIYSIRDRSDAYRAFKKGLIKSTPWSTDEGEMSKKTVLRRLLKRVPMSPDLDRALAMEDEADRADTIIDHRDVPRPKTLAGKLDALALPHRGAAEDVAHDPETGEISDSGDAPTVTDAESDEAEARHERGPEPVKVTSGRIDAADHQPDQSGGGDDHVDPVADAHQRGREAKEAGLGTRAMPGEYREEGREAEAQAWMEGHKSAQKAEA